MAFKYYRQKKKLFYNWLLSYMLILSVPVITSGIVYLESAGIVKGEINRANESMLDQVKYQVDGRLNDIEQIGNQIAFNKGVQAALLVKGTFERNHQMNIYNILRDLEVKKSANGFIDDVYIFFKNTETVLDNQAQMDVKTFYRYFYDNKYMDYESWLEFLNQNSNVLALLYRTRENKTVEKIIAFAKPIRFLSKPLGIPPGTVVQIIDVSKYEEILENMKWEAESGIFIINDEDRVLVSTGIEIPSLQYDLLQKERDVFEDTIQGKNYTISYVSSTFTDWKYVTMMPSRVFWEKVEYIRKLTLYGVAVCIILGGFIAYFFSRMNYNPINKIIGILDKKGMLSFGDQYDEYGFILQAINSSMDEKEKITQRLEQQNNVLRTNSLVRILRGSIDYAMPVEEVLMSYNVRFNSDYFAVLLLYIDDFSDFFKQDVIMDMESTVKLVKFTIRNVVEELLNRSHIGYIVEIDDMLACIVNFKEGNQGKRIQEIVEITKEAQSFIRQNFKIYFTASISDINKGIEGVSSAYRQAVGTMECKMMLENRTIIRYEDVQSPEKMYNYPADIEEKLINYIKTGDFARASGLLEECFINDFTDKPSSIEVLKGLMFGIIVSIQKNVDKSFVSTLMEEQQPYKRLQSCKTIIKMKEETIHLLEVVCRYCKEYNDNGQNQLSKDIIDFIEKKYQDVNLSISMIGKQFNMTPPYISKLYKDQTGSRLLDSINSVRLENAKRLLSQGRLSIREIAGKTGFTNSSVFIRTFKKYEGITPGRYKEI